MIKIEIKQQKNIQSNHHYHCGTPKTILIGKYLFKDDDDVWQHKNCPLLKRISTQRKRDKKANNLAKLLV